MMDALVLKSYGNLVLSRVEKPVPGPDEVLIRIRATGICGSDVHGFNGSTGRRIPPLIMGHEAAGIIEASGKNVKEFQNGDRVTFDSTIYCGECFYCRQGKINFCQNRKVLGVGCDEYSRDGTFAEYICVPERILYRLPDELSFQEGAMIEPLSIALHAVNITPVSLGDTAIVFGAGVIGLLTLQVLLASGCSRVFVADLDEERLNIARELGAAGVFNSAEKDVPREILALTGGRGADCAIDAVGLSVTANSGLQTLGRGGTLTMIGNFSPDIDIPLQAVVARQLRLQGSNASAGEYQICIDMIRSRRIDVSKLISQAVPLSEGASRMELLEKGSASLLKVILLP